MRKWILFNVWGIFVALLPSSILAADGAKLVKQDQGVFFYEAEKEKSVSVIQFQLKGHIISFSDGDDAVTLRFKGQIKMYSTGADLEGPEKSIRLLTWRVTDLPIVIAEWDAGVTPWSEQNLSYQSQLKLLELAVTSKQEVIAAIKNPAFVFYNTGDLLRITGDRIAFGGQEASRVWENLEN